MKKHYLLIILLLFYFPAHASQWQQLAGPYGNVSSVLGVHNGYLFSSNNYNQVMNGVYRTNNSGNTWTDVSAGLQKPYSNAFASIGSNLFSCSDTMVYMSTDNGNTWTDASGNLPTWGFVRNLVSHNNVLLAAVYNQNGYDEIFYTTNNGTTWTNTSFITPGVNDFYSDGNNLWLCGSDGAIYLSTDDGLTWNLRAGNIPFSANVTGIGGAGDTMYCGANNYIYMTTDGGLLWMPLTSGLPPQITAMDFCRNGNTIYASTLNEGVYSSTIGSTSWAQFGTGLPYYLAAFSIEIVSNNLFIATFEGVWTNTTSGGAWTLKNNGLNNGIVRTVYSEGNFMLAAIGSVQGLQYSNDAGATWSPTNLGNNTYISWIKKIGGIYWCGSNLGGLRTSADGITWTSVSGVFSGTWNMISNGGKLIVAAENGALVSTDNGLSWNLSNTGLPANPQLWRILTIGADVYAMVNGKGIYVSHDGCNTWQAFNQNLSNLTSINDFYNVGNFLVVERFTGRMRRLISDTAWTLVPTTNFSTGYVFESRDEIIYSGSSQGVFISDDVGETFHAWNDGFDGQIVNDWRELSFDGNTIFGGTQGFGAWKRNFFPEIITSTINPGPYCAGNTFTVNYNSALTFNSGNKFIVQLSDSAGHFINNPLRLDSVIATTPQAMTVTVPSGLKESNLYRIRVIATDPYVVVEDCNCNISIEATPAINLQPANQNTCEGNGSGFYIGASGSNLFYQWQVNTGSGWSNLVNNSTYQNVNDPLMLISSVVTTMNGYQYRCIITGSCPPALTSNAATLSVNVAPVFTQQPVSDTICEFSSTYFACVATGGSVTYRWQYDNGSGFFTDVPNVAPFSNVATNTLDIVNAPAIYNGYSFRCKIGNSCTFSDAAVLVINGTPQSNNLSLNLQVCDGGTASIGVDIAGAGITYQWQENNGSGWVNLNNGGNYSGVFSDLLTINNVSQSMTGYQYQCIINGVCAPFASTSNPATISVITNNVTILLQPQNKSACEQNGTFFSVSATGGFVFYQWEMNDGSGWLPLQNVYPFSGVNADTLFIESVSLPISGYQFRCLIGGCTYTNAVGLVVIALPVVTLSQFPGYFCFNDPQINLTGGLPAGGTYFGNGVYNGQFNPASAGVGNATLTYVYTNGAGCTNSAEQILTVSNCIGVGLNETTTPDNSILIYPNPASDYVVLKLKSKPVKNYMVKIYNATGVLVFNREIVQSENEIVIPVSEFSDGLYLISVEGEKRLLKRFLVMK